MPAPENRTPESSPETNPTAPPGMVLPPNATPEQAEALKAIMDMKQGNQAMQAYALQRAAESEARLIRIENEVFQRGMQLARIERNLVVLIGKEKYVP